MLSPNINDLPAPGYDRTGWPWAVATPQFAETMPDGSPWPCISIVTPSYNQGKFIEETIRSVLLQGYPNLEYLIVDGGSTDESVGIIKKYEPWLTYWISEPDKGQCHAINKGFERCSGDVLNWLNSDDYLLPDALMRIATQYYNRKSELCIIAGNALILDIHGNLIPRRPVLPTTSWLKEFGVKYDGGIQASWFFSKALLEAIGPLDEMLHYSMDIDYSLRWTHFNPEYLIESMPLAIYRSHADAKTRKFINNSLIERLSLYKRIISSMQISNSKKRYLTTVVSKEISGMYLSNLGKPLNFDFLSKSLVLYPKRVFTRDFWNIILR